MLEAVGFAPGKRKKHLKAFSNYKYKPFYADVRGQIKSFYGFSKRNLSCLFLHDSSVYTLFGNILFMFMDT